MARKKITFNAEDWAKAYKNYLLQHGDILKEVKTLLHFTERPFVEFRKSFETLEELELTIVAAYFKKALKELEKDESFSSHSPKEQHLAFLYLLIELITEDEIFLTSFYKAKMKDSSFMIKLQKELKHHEISWAEMSGWRPDFVDKLNINPKKSILINHAFTCIVFFLKDKSSEKVDSDAYIEKTTDLLYKLTDTSTINSIVDLGRFMYSRKQTAFS